MIESGHPYRLVSSRLSHKLAQFGEVTVNTIIAGIRTVMGGGASLDAGVARFIINTLKNRLPKNCADVLLTGRQMEVLTMLGEGLLKKEIADRLQISYATVDEHVAHIYDRLGVRNAPAAVNKAHQLGIFSFRRAARLPIGYE